MCDTAYHNEALRRTRVLQREAERRRAADPNSFDNKDAEQAAKGGNNPFSDPTPVLPTTSQREESEEEKKKVKSQIFQSTSDTTNSHEPLKCICRCHVADKEPSTYRPPVVPKSETTMRDLLSYSYTWDRIKDTMYDDRPKTPCLMCDCHKKQSQSQTGLERKVSNEACNEPQEFFSHGKPWRDELKLPPIKPKIGGSMEDYMANIYNLAYSNKEKMEKEDMARVQKVPDLCAVDPKQEEGNFEAAPPNVPDVRNVCNSNSNTNLRHSPGVDNLSSNDLSALESQREAMKTPPGESRAELMERGTPRQLPAMDDSLGIDRPLQGLPSVIGHRVANSRFGDKTPPKMDSNRRLYSRMRDNCGNGVSGKSDSQASTPQRLSRCQSATSQKAVYSSPINVHDLSYTDYARASPGQIASIRQGQGMQKQNRPGFYLGENDPNDGIAVMNVTRDNTICNVPAFSLRTMSRRLKRPESASATPTFYKDGMLQKDVYLQPSAMPTAKKELPFRNSPGPRSFSDDKVDFCGTQPRKFPVINSLVQSTRRDDRGSLFNAGQNRFGARPICTPLPERDRFDASNSPHSAEVASFLKAVNEDLSQLKKKQYPAINSLLSSD